MLWRVRALFVELPAFERNRSRYLTDLEFADLQQTLLVNPGAGDVIKDTGGLRKVRFADSRRNKGTRGGLRVIYFWWEAGAQFWLFALFDKSEMSDLSKDERKAMKVRLKAELKARKS